MVWITIHLGKKPRRGGTPPNDKINKVVHKYEEYWWIDILFIDDDKKEDEKWNRSINGAVIIIYIMK